MKDSLIADKIRTEKLKSGWRYSICADIGKERLELYYCVRSEESIVEEAANAADAFFISLSIIALERGVPLFFSIPISRELYYNAGDAFNIAAQCIGVTPVEWDAPVVLESAPMAKGCATGISNGVDSLFTIKKINESKVNAKLDYLLFNNTGSHGSDENKKAFGTRLERVDRIAKRLKIPLVTIDSNVHHYVKSSYIRVHSFLNAACAHLLSGMISHYMYASAGIGLPGYSLHGEGDSARADPALLPLLSTRSLKIHQPDISTKRFDKVRALADFPLAREYLEVCVDHQRKAEPPNCGRCEKCLRTCLALEVLGKLDVFAHRFDMDAYWRHRDWFIVATARSKELARVDLIEQLLKSDLRVPFMARILHKTKPIWIPSKVVQPIASLYKK